ncbi:hypothetical protein LJR189_004755 [Acidovorax delafieldii]|uniref:hypothetical protein n=1 Tax=Acidovorax delafieldii TaxID=47920 RepID=UPI003ECE7CF2
MGGIQFPGEAMVRKADAPPQPAGTRWYTDCGNAAGTAHLYTTEREGLLVSHCGREILLSDRQEESAALGYCKRCMKHAERK